MWCCAPWWRASRPTGCVGCHAGQPVQRCTANASCERFRCFAAAALACGLQTVMGHMAQLRQLMGVSDDLHKV